MTEAAKFINNNWIKLKSGGAIKFAKTRNEFLKSIMRHLRLATKI